MNKTGIEWVKNPDGTQGYTWNPITGCLNHNNGLCKGGGFPCYAYKLANRRLRQRYLANNNTAPLPLSVNLLNIDIDDPFYPRFWSERLVEIRPDTKAKGIFVCDMSDLFGKGIPEEWTREVLDMCQGLFEHRFYLLTKQPQNLIKFSPFPPNCYVGVTCTNALMFQKALPELYRITAKVKFISFEPLLSAMWENQLADGFELVSWVIIGAQTKPTKYPPIEAIEEIVRACDKAGVPVFLKDNLWSLFDGSGYAVPLWAFNKDSKLRQEIPSG